jgi:hypothetical protein
LEGTWRIEKEKRHDQEFIMSLMSYGRSIHNVFILHPYFLITEAKVQFGEYIGTLEFI